MSLTDFLPASDRGVFGEGLTVTNERACCRNYPAGTGKASIRRSATKHDRWKARPFFYGCSSVCSCACWPSLAKRASSLAVSVRATPVLVPLS